MVPVFLQMEMCPFVKQLYFVASLAFGSLGREWDHML